MNGQSGLQKCKSLLENFHMVLTLFSFHSSLIPFWSHLPLVTFYFCLIPFGSICFGLIQFWSNFYLLTMKYFAVRIREEKWRERKTSSCLGCHRCGSKSGLVQQLIRPCCYVIFVVCFKLLKQIFGGDNFNQFFLWLQSFWNIICWYSLGTIQSAIFLNFWHLLPYIGSYFSTIHW